MSTLQNFSGGDGLRLIVNHKKTGEYFLPAVLDGVTWETRRKGAPGKLTFRVVYDDVLQMEYGDTIDVTWDGTQFFHGFIFSKKRNKDKQWDVVAYDQIRYLLNKDTFSYIGKRADEVIRELANDYELLVGELDNTEFVIEKRRESNATILDMCQTALDLTMIHTNKLYVIYDDCGRLMLKDLEAMQADILIDADTAQDYSYEGSIDKNTFNLVKLDVDEGEGGHKTYYAPASTEEYQNSETRKQWGVLQFYENVNAKNQNPQDLANRYLEHYNRVRRSLSVSGAAGDISIRGGSMIWLNMNLGEGENAEKQAKRVIVEGVTHRFSNGSHVMDLDLRGDLLNG